MITTRLFTSNTTQAVRLPRAVAFPDDVREVEVMIVGEGRLIIPAGRAWEFYFAHGRRVTDDFMSERDQPEPQERVGL